jgi:hypothetical protein
MFLITRASTAIAASLMLALTIVLPSYDPPDVGGPGSTQGSGTRYTASPLQSL